MIKVMTVGDDNVIPHGVTAKRHPRKKAPQEKGTLEKGTPGKGTLQKGTNLYNRHPIKMITL